MMDARVVEWLEAMQKRPGVSADALERLHRYAGRELPADYVEFLRWSNGANGPMWPYLPLIAGKLRHAMHHSLFRAEEVLELTVSPKGYARKWHALYPGHLVISFSGAYIGLLDIRGAEPTALTYAVADGYMGASQYPQEGDEMIVYRVSSFYDLASTRWPDGFDPQQHGAVKAE